MICCSNEIVLCLISYANHIHLASASNYPAQCCLWRASDLNSLYHVTNTKPLLSLWNLHHHFCVNRFPSPSLSFAHSLNAFPQDFVLIFCSSVPSPRAALVISITIIISIILQDLYLSLVFNLSWVSGPISNYC